MKGEDLRRVGDFEALCRYLEEKLGWPLGEYDFDALTFQYEPEELGLQDAYADAVESIHQLRPVTDGQPWGIFFVRFKKQKLPVGVLRRILSQLALKKRASANKAERAAWLVDDLLFVSAFGDEAGKNREIAFAHFHQHGGDLPTLRVIGWDGNDTPLKLDYLQGMLANKLQWPADPADVESWRTLWRSPFRHRPGHVIRKSDELAHELAKLARAIRDRAFAVMKAESAKGPLTKLYDAFKKALIHDLTPEGFADTYAQTITYGLLTAAISRTEMSEGRHGTVLLASDLADMVPVTNPFLKEMLQTFLEAGGRKGGIDFDELGVQDVVELLRGEDTDLPAILRDFGNRTRGEDPVIHFYEHFLKAYNKQLKVQRGVFYTPQPVVSYIVRSVHELLQTNFGLADGLADVTTWGEMLERHPDLTPPLLSDTAGDTRTISPEEPFVQILDPATGTATFLVEVIDVIYRTLTEKWNTQHLTDAQQLEAWNEYVPKHLLPRLHAYELMMAPYAIAHMKVGLKLAETGYRFDAPVRARIYLTNALEPWVRQLPMIGFEALAHEAAAVNEIKRHKRFTVVAGNPPYSGVSSNNSAYALRLVDAYKVVDGERLEEKKLWLQDDYVKFMRSAQMTIERAGCGVLGFITNHGYLDNPTFRGMRQSLLNSFQWRQVIDLHGNTKKKEVAPDGTPDANVFDIQQGVAVGLFVRRLAAMSVDTLTSRGDVFGSREIKYRTLASASLHSLGTVHLCPTSPFYLFVQQDQTNRQEFESMMLLSKVAELHSVGVVTARDQLTIAFTEAEIWDRVQNFARLGAEQARQEFELRKDVRDWKVSLAQADLRSKPLSRKLVKPVLYRPFDIRFTYYTGKNKGFIGQPATAIMSHMIDGRNIGLMTTRKVEVGTFGHALCSRVMTESHSVSLKEVNYLFPLWLYPDSDELAFFSEERQPNFTPQFLRALCSALRLQPNGPHGLPTGVTAEQIFHYSYAVLHSPAYRARYSEFLKVDFPRLPLIRNLDLFRHLARLGSDLCSLHVLESPVLNQRLTEVVGARTLEVEKVAWTDNTVWVDRAQATGFRGVREEVWNFRVGGYQVCEKWLKDRKGRTLSSDEIAQYHKIVVALSETIRLMGAIDSVIARHGGWPGAFVNSTETAGVEGEPQGEPSRPVTSGAPRTHQAADGLCAGAAKSQASMAEVTNSGACRADLDDTDALCAAFRQHLGHGQSHSRDDAITTLARALGYQRTTSAVRETLDNAIRTAVRRGILQNGSEGLCLRYRTLEQHGSEDRDGLKEQFLASLGGRAWAEREDAIRGFARWLGFRRTGPKIDEVAASLINGLLREARLEKEGSRIRRA